MCLGGHKKKYGSRAQPSHVSTMLQVSPPEYKPEPEPESCDFRSDLNRLKSPIAAMPFHWIMVRGMNEYL